jgi:hypothetical protein
MNRTGPSKPGGGDHAADGPTTRAALAKAVGEEEARLHRREVEHAESKRRLDLLRADLAERDARRETPAKLKIAEPLANGPRTPADKVKLFRQLFRGRPDLYPTRFVSKKTGKADAKRRSTTTPSSV